MPYLEYLAPRNPLTDAKDTLSSWDKCMAKTYCKWPVIVAIIIGVLILLSVLFCLVRCICCGAEIACCCFKCCTCCCGGNSKGHRRVASEPPPPPVYGGGYASSTPAGGRTYDTRPVNQQYRSHAAPAFASEPERPQYASFETPSKPVNEDALPNMPTWSEATSTKVQVEVQETALPEKQGDVEMDRLDYNGGVAMAAAARRSPARSPVQRSPTQDSYGFPPGYHHNDSYVGGGGGAARRSPGPRPPQGAQYAHSDDGYRGISPVHAQSPVHAHSLSPVHAHSTSPVYGASPGYPTTTSPTYGRRSPNAPPYDPYDGPAPPPRHTPEASSTAYAYDNSNARTDAPYPNQDYGIDYNNNNPPSGSTRFEQQPPASAAMATYPGQQSYGTEERQYPGQQAYHAYTPAPAPQGEQYTGVSRKAVEGSWKEV
ncbi:uncharacterized protein EI97DRAFT_197765 [Westerdykella ornata]|uniref:Fibroin-3 related protein n=1 Tax=Westerdykella ornata TaxID=318751 RepID=A0A6A6J994_WESOR|nr:uncharacterized protein EI97DRAFT_197765 [Westerdykella ornata]KAF2272847.1 hypothetical protein EI97DRAFT_197765 [Westerdykella ornata]